MKIDQYIAELQKIRASHGTDLEVTTVAVLGGVAKAGLPRVEFLHLKRPRTWFVNGSDKDADRGAKVVRV